MKELDDMEVNVLLLRFSALSEEKKCLFIDRMNRYLLASPRRCRQLRLCWEKSRISKDKPLNA